MKITDYPPLQCSLCGHPRLKPVFKKQSRVFYECARCEHVRVFPYPSEIETAAYYEQSYTPNYLSQNIAWFKLLAGKRVRILKDHLGEEFAGSLLDIGSGYGFFLKEAESCGWKVLGIESSPDEVDYAREQLGADVLDIDVQKALASLPGSSFDAVTFWHVLEHLERPAAAIRGSKRLLKNGGLLAINSPNLDSAVFRLLKTGWSWIHVPGHLQYFRAKPFSGWLENQGLTVQTLETWTLPPNLYFTIEEALLLRLSNILERKGGRIGRLGRTLRYFVHGSFHQHVVQMKAEALYRLTPFLERYLKTRLLGHEFLIIARNCP